MSSKDSSRETPGTAFKLSEDLTFTKSSSSVTRRFDAFQTGSAQSAMSAKHMAQYVRPSIDGLPMQGPIHLDTFKDMSSEVRAERVRSDKNFKSSMTNTVMLTDLSSVTRAASVKKRDDVGEGRGVVMSTSSTGTTTAVTPK